MKTTIYFALFIALILPGCIVIEDDPLVVVEPGVEFQGHIRNDEVYITATVSANPSFINPGNIPVLLKYEGSISLYDEESGSLLSVADISGEGLTAIAVVTTSAHSFENMIVIVSGTVSAYADKESDGDPSNDIFIHSADFYQEETLINIVQIEDYPVVTVEPDVNFQMYIRSKELYTTATIRANPTYIITGTSAINFKYEGVLQVYDVISGALLKSTSLAGSGLSNSVTILTDTTSFDGFVIIASGSVTCTEDVGNDGLSSNDRTLSSADFYEIQEIDLRE